MSQSLGNPAWCFLFTGFLVLSAGFVYTQMANGNVLEGEKTGLDNESICESVKQGPYWIDPTKNTDFVQDDLKYYREKTVNFDLKQKKTAEQNTNFLLSPAKESSNLPQLSHFPSYFPHIFVSAHSISHSEPYSSPFEYSQVLYFLYCSIELFLTFSHILVHLGIKNSRYRFLTKQKMYFAVDGSLSTVNLIVFWENYYYMRFFLVLAIFLHAYYVVDLVFTNGKSKIFKWSSVDLGKDRFGVENIKENIETLVDDCCHFTGFLSAFLELPSLLKVLAIGFGLGVLWLLVLKAKFFFTKKHMMPCWLKNLIPEDSR